MARSVISKPGGDNPGKTASNQGKTAISTKEAPAAIGPYSQAVRVGDTLFASGQVGLDPATGQLVSGGIAEQTVRVLENEGSPGCWARSGPGSQKPPCS